jgi:MurNAc alpha-1-phosphate uridylyltransferase
MQCVILAGGLGTRLWPITKSIPKTLIPIHGRPFADYQLSWLARHQVTQVVYSIGFLGEQIREHVGDGAAFGLEVRYVDEGSNLKGTAGALRRALDAGLLDDVFFVLYGDSFLPIEFAPVMAAYQKSGRSALMTVMQNCDRWDHSNVIFTAPTVALYDKTADDYTRARMSYIDYGLSIVSRRIIANLVASGSTADLGDLFKELSIGGELAGLEVSQRFFEIGSSRGIADFTQYVKETGLQPSSQH